jgi:hypothetical protein
MVILKYGALIWLLSVVLLAGLLACDVCLSRRRVRRVAQRNQPNE